MTILVGGLGGPERERMARPTGCNLCAPICQCGAEEAQACRTLQDREAPETWRERARLAEALLVPLPEDDPGDDFDPTYEGDMDALLAAFHGEGT